MPISLLILIVDSRKSFGFLRRLGCLLLLNALLGCQSVATIQSVQFQPRRNWLTSTVYLQGTIGDRAPLLNGQVYELKDGTGKIWVLSSARQRKTGDQIRIKGKIRYQAIDIAGQNLGEAYIEEQQQLEPQ